MALESPQQTQSGQQPQSPRADPLAPQKLDQQLEQQTNDMFAKAQKLEQEKTEEEIRRKAAEEFDRVRKLGFLTNVDMKDTLAKKDEQINKLFAEIQQIKAYLKSVSTPAQNSGMLDDPKPIEKNPLIIW